ncbi:MAG: hypothetical protein WAT67_08455 [Candidatus Contendobacter sp.]
MRSPRPVIDNSVKAWLETTQRELAKTLGEWAFCAAVLLVYTGTLFKRLKAG